MNIDLGRKLVLLSLEMIRQTIKPKEGKGINRKCIFKDSLQYLSFNASNQHFTKAYILSTYEKICKYISSVKVNTYFCITSLRFDYIQKTQ